MSNNYFSFKQFTIWQDKSAFKVGTDGVLLGAVTDVSGAKSILDIGSGTGLVAIMLAQRCEAEITAIEPDHESYLQAYSNARNCKWSNRIMVCETNLQDYCPDVKFDLIVSNPPYFVDSMQNPDPRKSAARHNDSLNSDDLLKGISRLLSNDGKFQLIMPYVEGNIFIADAQKYGFYCNSILKIKPLPTAEIRRLILTFGRNRLKSMEKFLTIERGKRYDFTEDYINLTKDFYLKL
ncbi:MAG TPA: methyltransferase [Bacteroidales bacterium]|nr:methyltransferase [Bacteroidales bacterium]HPT21658.1 methyltransferase [Bacteroidales bacterium]